MAIPSCPGVVVDVSGTPTCQDEMGAPLAWESIPEFDIELVDPVVAGEAFGAGFVIVATAWVIGFGVRALLSQIRSR